MMNNDVREITPIRWFDDRDAVTATKDFRPRAEKAGEVEDEPPVVPGKPARKEPAKD